MWNNSSLRTLNQVTVVGTSQASYAQNMKSVLPMKIVLYVVSEPIILGFKSKTKNISITIQSYQVFHFIIWTKRFLKYLLFQRYLPFWLQSSSRLFDPSPDASSFVGNEWTPPDLNSVKQNKIIL